MEERESVARDEDAAALHRCLSFRQKRMAGRQAAKLLSPPSAGNADLTAEALAVHAKSRILCQR